ncbi:MAG: sigma-54-dependent Fis family transcriptional regulator [Rhizobiales bacterium]|nr:sigma-54-dependent Fis family transcriptional regulator [Hyphomicrobiales bacterium]OJY40815.1 MAG: sigma-54-dependent Fis family transcriptional regulator [Rhizobiales bacterium 64-17]
MTARILIVDDDPVQRRLLEAMVQRFGYGTQTLDGGDAAARLLTGPEAAGIDGVVLDLVMPDLDGLGVLAKMREAGCTIPVIVQTAHGGIDNVVSAMRAGAADFIVKPASPERLQVSLRNALQTRALSGELARVKRSREGTLTFTDVISRAPAMRPVLRAAEKAATSDIPALIEGESGTGKELIARAIHGSGARRAKPFVAVNCGAIPENLVESTLFGHERGAFTGATDKHTGKFIEADGGTLFLDEIGELPLAAQVKLLRALQEGEVEPVGARKPVKVNVRIISATNRDLISEVKAARFREDLFYRLNVFPVYVPPLRQRADDIADLARHFLARFAAEEGKPVRGISAEAMAMLDAFAWPGNVRQLENTMFRAVVLCEGEEIGAGDLPQIGAQLGQHGHNALSTIVSIVPEQHAHAEMQPMTGQIQNVAAFTMPDHALPLIDAQGDVRPFDALERDIIRFAIAHYRGRMSEVARRLRIGRSTLYRKLEGLGLDDAPTSLPAE